jgi:hypothetical protein
MTPKEPPCALLLTFLTVSLGPATAHAETISFDTDASGNPLSAPRFFASTRPLTERYADLGVHFRGTKPGIGAAILDRRSNFGVRARSAPNLLAFSEGSYGKPPEIVTFDSPQRRVLIFAGTGYGGSNRFSMTGFLGNEVVGKAEIRVFPRHYGRLKLVSDSGINRVRIRARNSKTFVLDDLRFSPLR